MERLSLGKFEDRKLEKKQMHYIHAGSCTGGGTQFFWTSGDNPRLWKTISWDSDESNGSHTMYAGMSTTHYHAPELQSNPYL